jgi:hypothetical protein
MRENGGFISRKVSNGLVLLLTILSVSLLTGCMEDDFTSASGKQITFSTDTVSFDTLFTNQTSVTAIVKIYNRNKESLRIASMRLAGGSESPFKINVNGQSNRLQQFSGVEVLGKDSIYLFVQVTPPATGENVPVLLEDSVIVMTNGVEKHLILRAVGQDVVILDQETVLGTKTLTADRPYLILGELTVGEGGRLTIDPGARLYFHYNAGMTVRGRLDAQGTEEHPIRMMGDRLDNVFDGVPYDSLSQQWRGITFITSEPQQLSYVRMTSGTTGLDMDSSATEIKVSHCIIHNFSRYGISATNSKAIIDNTQITNGGINAVRLTGGDWEMDRCIIANYNRNRSGVAMRVSNRPGGKSEEKTPLKKGRVENSIIAGNRNGELVIDKAEDSEWDMRLVRCWINGMETSDTELFSDCVWGNPQAELFVNTERYPYDFSIKEDSPAKDIIHP